MVSALILEVAPSVPTPIGATTGIMPAADSVSSRLRSNFDGSPTKPRSSAFSMRLPGSRVVRCTFEAVPKLRSLHDMQTARTPARLFQRTGEHTYELQSHMRSLCRVFRLHKTITYYHP